MAQVVIYSSGACPYCVQAKDLLEKKGVDYQEIRIDREPEKLEEMLAKSANRRSVPQIFIGDLHVGGYSELYALEQKGELDPLLS